MAAAAHTGLISIQEGVPDAIDYMQHSRWSGQYDYTTEQQAAGRASELWPCLLAERFMEPAMPGEQEPDTQSLLRSDLSAELMQTHDSTHQQLHNSTMLTCCPFGCCSLCDLSLSGGSSYAPKQRGASLLPARYLSQSC